MASIILESTSQIPLIVTGIVSQLEPSGVPQFQFTATSVTNPVGANWEDGSWSGTWDAATGAGREAVTPVIGSAGFTITEGKQTLWIRWPAGAHTPVFEVATVSAT